jgi:hypothetical protein
MKGSNLLLVSIGLKQYVTGFCGYYSFSYVLLIGQDLFWLHTSFIDVKAALLVFVMPWLVLMIFRKDRISFRLLFSRMKETREVSNEQLVTEMLGLTDQNW